MQQEYYIGDEENKMATGQYLLNLRTPEQLVIDITSKSMGRMDRYIRNAFYWIGH